MATGISKTQLVLLRGSLRTLVLFGPLYVAGPGARHAWTTASLTWDTWLGGAPYDGRLPLAEGAQRRGRRQRHDPAGRPEHRRCGSRPSRPR